MGKIKLICAAVVVVGLVFLWQWEQRSNEKLRRENESLRLNLAQLKQSQEERESVPADNSLAKEQLAELLRLRSEVTQLRAQTNQIAVLTRANEKLLASLNESKSSRTNISKKTSPQDALPQDIHPKESWMFRGYNSPEDAVESISWAMMKGDKATFLDGFAPELKSKIESDLNNKDFAAETSSHQISEFRILDRQMQSDDQMTLTVYFTRKDESGNDVGKSEDTIFRKIDGQWKLADPIK